MQIKIDTTPYATLETDAIVSYVFDETDPIQGTLADIDKSANGLLKKLATGAEFSGKPLEMTLIHAPAGLKAARLLLVGAGKRDKFDVATLRKIAGAATALSEVPLNQEIRLPRPRKRPERSFRRRPSSKAPSPPISRPTNTSPTRSPAKTSSRSAILGYYDSNKSAGEKGLAKGQIIAESQNFARDLVNEPSNKLTPKILADKAAAMAKEAGLAVDILDEKKIAELKMGALLGVAQGGPEPPRMIVITYTPAGERQTRRSGHRPRRQSRHLRHRRHLHQARRRHGKNEVRHGRRRHHDRRDARSRRRSSPTSK